MPPSWLLELSFCKLGQTTRNILWLSGAAGSGKTTISVTLSDACEEYCRSIQVFFERGKSDPSYVIRTIANKLACLHNSVARYILRAFEQNRNITSLDRGDFCGWRWGVGKYGQINIRNLSSSKLQLISHLDCLVCQTKFLDKISLYLCKKK